MRKTPEATTTAASAFAPKDVIAGLAIACMLLGASFEVSEGLSEGIKRTCNPTEQVSFTPNPLPAIREPLAALTSLVVHGADLPNCQ